MKAIQPIHPFPARMASEVAFKEIKPLASGSLILDPMVGSGTAARVATELGHQALGFDLDPLAILMSRVWTTPLNTQVLLQSANRLMYEAKQIGDVELDWIDGDRKTQEFVDFWFAHKQQKALRGISHLLKDMQGSVADALRIALSRIIITKKGGASLAWDTSHSRPHRVSIENNYDVYVGFLKSVNRLAQQFEKHPPRGNAEIRSGDARNLNTVTDESIHAVVTSPPYLNAISYLRGHRLSLVWLGHRVGDLKTLGYDVVGSQKSVSETAKRTLIDRVVPEMGSVDQLPLNEQHLIQRYVVDIYGIVREVGRVLCPKGRAVFVIGDSCLRGILVKNSQGLKSIARYAGLTFIGEHTREIPANRRYLPPPNTPGGSALQKRMREEHVITFAKT